MLKVIILVCAATLDHAACDQTNAIDVVRGPAVASVQQCLFHGMSLLAQTSIAPEPGHQFAKVVCLREREVSR